MSFENVKEYFKNLGMEELVLSFDVSSATVELAAEAVGVEPARIAKTMSFFLSSGPILIVTAGDTKIDNSKYKQQFHEKAKMIPFDKVEEYIGHAPGGVCPFLTNENVKIYLDESLKRFETVYPAAGSGNSAVKLTTKQLEDTSNYSEWVDVCKIIVSEQ